MRVRAGKRPRDGQGRSPRSGCFVLYYHLPIPGWLENRRLERIRLREQIALVGIAGGRGSGETDESRAKVTKRQTKASGGLFSGTLSVSQPTNPSGVQLTEGRDSKTFPFTLKAGQKTSETTPPQTGTFTIRTAPANGQ